ncbi:MAG: radical SAM protein [Patescibacteria group bacterium]|nr:radical SAM protein [Patescibacteria group bacterium]
MEQIRPQGVWLTVNRRCNFRCKWCYAKNTKYDSSQEMDWQLAQKLVDVCSVIGVKTILIIGGEPTLWSDLAKLNDLCRDYGVKTILVTNAMRFGFDSYWRQYLKSPNDMVGISLKAGNSEQLVAVAEVKQFDIVKKGISRAIEHFETGVSITYNSFYAENLPEIVQFAIDCGARMVKIDFCSTVFMNHKPSGKYMVEPHQLVKNIVHDYPQLHNITSGHLVFEMSIPFYLWPIGFIELLKERNQITSVCHVLKREGLVFDTNGNVIMCNGLFDYPIGHCGIDYSDADSLLELINSPQVSEYYEQMVRYPLPKCVQCQDYQECGGGCPLRWALYKPEELL